MAGLLVNPPNIKPLADAVDAIIKADGFDKQFLLSSEREETAIINAVNEIVYSVVDFDWYFDPEDDRNLRIPKTKVPDKNDLAELVGKVVEEGLADLRDIEALGVEPDIEKLVGDLVGYILNWQDWYYDFKVGEDQDEWSEGSYLDEIIYENSDYGDPESSQGVSNLYDEESAPFPDKIISLYS